MDPGRKPESPSGIVPWQREEEELGRESEAGDERAAGGSQSPPEAAQPRRAERRDPEPDQGCRGRGHFRTRLPPDHGGGDQPPVRGELGGGAAPFRRQGRHPDRGARGLVQPLRRATREPLRRGQTARRTRRFVRRRSVGALRKSPLPLHAGDPAQHAASRLVLPGASTARRDPRGMERHLGSLLRRSGACRPATRSPSSTTRSRSCRAWRP